MKTTLLTLTALLSFALPAEARRQEVSSFDELMHAARGHIENQHSLQAEAQRPFLLVAPRCLNRWNEYEAEYHRVQAELKELTQPLSEALAGYLRMVRAYHTDAAGLTLEAACGPDGARMEREILAKREIVKRLAHHIAPTAEAVEALHRRAFHTFVTAAESDFGRSLGCLFWYQYRDVALLAMFRDYYPRGERAPAPALYQIGADLDRVPYFAREEEKSLTESLVRLNSLRLSCKRR